MDRMKDRPYQSELHAAIRQAIRDGHRIILVQLPTGGGKTNIGGKLMAGAERKENPSLFCAPRRELVTQTRDRLARFGVSAGIIMAGHPAERHRLSQVASFDTLHHRAVLRDSIELPDAVLVVVDEAHLSLSETRENILAQYPTAIIIGLTATPARGDGKPLGALYQHLILGWSTGRMMAEGYLTEVKYFAPTEPDLSGVKVRRGDYVEAGLAKVMDNPKLVGDVVGNWLRLANDQPTVVFAVNKAHAKHLTAEFRKAGVTAELVVAETPKEERADIFARVESGETRVLVNVFVASYGLDIPPLAVCVLARPTKSLVLYLQMVGRVLRPLYADWATEELLEESAEVRRAAIADSVKPYAMVIDHAGAVLTHGFVDEDVPWTLLGDESISDAKQREREARNEPKELTCPRCRTVFKGTKFCPGCGFELVAPGAPQPVHKPEAELQEVVRDGNKANKKTPWPEKIRFMGMAKSYAASKGAKDGFAANLYRDKFGVWPNDGRVREAAPVPFDDTFRRFIQHRAIKRRHERT